MIAAQNLAYPTYFMHLCMKNHSIAAILGNISQERAAICQARLKESAADSSGEIYGSQRVDGNLKF